MIPQSGNHGTKNASKSAADRFMNDFKGVQNNSFFTQN